MNGTVALVMKIRQAHEDLGMDEYETGSPRTRLFDPQRPFFHGNSLDR